MSPVLGSDYRSNAQVDNIEVPRSHSHKSIPLIDHRLFLTTKYENCTECWAENARKSIEQDENVEESVGKTEVLATNEIVQFLG